MAIDEDWANISKSPKQWAQLSCPPSAHKNKTHTVLGTTILGITAWPAVRARRGWHAGSASGSGSATVPVALCHSAAGSASECKHLKQATTHHAPPTAKQGEERVGQNII